MDASKLNNKRKLSAGPSSLSQSMQYNQDGTSSYFIAHDKVVNENHHSVISTSSYNMTSFSGHINQANASRGSASATSLSEYSIPDQPISNTPSTITAPVVMRAEHLQSQNKDVKCSEHNATNSPGYNISTKSNSIHCNNEDGGGNYGCRSISGCHMAVNNEGCVLNNLPDSSCPSKANRQLEPSSRKRNTDGAMCNSSLSNTSSNKRSKRLLSFIPTECSSLEHKVKRIYL